MTDRQGLSLPPQRLQTRSPSHVAALIAAARAEQAKLNDASKKAKPPVIPKPRRLSNTHAQDIPASTETASIQPTTSLVDLFEQKSSKSEPLVNIPNKPPSIQSPKPYRPDGIHSVFKMEVGTVGAVQSRSEGDNRSKEVESLQKDKSSTSNKLLSSTTDENTGRSKADSRQGSKGYKIRDTTEARDFASGQRPQDEQVGYNGEKDMIGVSKSRPLSRSVTRSTSRSEIQPLSRTQTAPITIRRPSNTYEPSHSSQSVSATYRQLYPPRRTPLTTDNELANAIVASSLASSRLSSPSRLEAPPVPLARRQSRHFFHSRTPSPTKPGLRQTLRKQESSDSDDEHPYGKHQKKRLIRKHPNKHNEGDRKRWRDAVTEGERKRYEGVWAANKGLYVSPIPRDADADNLNDQVSNVVVKDIWNRSRLPEFELEAVWDLVDNDETGRLSKEEFVVGMWLIDQRLKGRKLPVKVQPTVWTSVRQLRGIKVRKQ